MKESFITKRFGDDALQRIEDVNTVIDEFGEELEDDSRLSLRQIYYKLVKKNLITNTDEEYKKLGKLISDGRLAGLIDWDAMEDRVRVPNEPYYERSIQSVVDSIKNQAEYYTLFRWDGQPMHVEVWVEKDTIADTFSHMVDAMHITLMTNRGYSSQSAMYAAAQRFKRIEEDEGKQVVLLYVGDHDPSGEHMVVDVRERLELFGAHPEVRKIALTIEQVRAQKLPHNPAKLTDPRAVEYVRKHGKKSWELEALSPRWLIDHVAAEVKALIKPGPLKKVLAKQAADRAKLQGIIDTLQE